MFGPKAFRSSAICLWFILEISWSHPGCRVNESGSGFNVGGNSFRDRVCNIVDCS